MTEELKPVATRWEQVGFDADELWRYPVPGGWIYGEIGPGLVFVPDPEFYRKLDQDDPNHPDNWREVSQ